ncbi:MAG: discoidin domain-containing protein, partial [Clostridiales bacterium]|nr:discoidin domain-containing protein [Clostridiales bacterium]
MSDRKGVLPIVLILALLCASVGVYAADFPPSEFRNICRLPEVTASASSVMANTAYTAEKAIDGTSDSNASRWISAVTSPVSAQWLTVDFKESYLLCGARLYSGYYDNANLSSPAVTFRYQYSAGLDGGGKDIWTDIPNASVTNNAEFVRDVVFGEGIVSDKIRLYVTGYTGTDSQVRIRELEVFAPLARQIPLAVSNVTTTGFDLSWDAVEDAAGYEVSVDDAAAVAVANHAYTVSGLNGGVTYSVKVAALDAGGEILGQGKTTVTTVSDLAAPGNLTATPSDTSVSLSWSASAGAAEYLVFRDGAEAGTVAGTSYTDAAVIPQKTYAYQVRAR